LPLGDANTGASWLQSQNFPLHGLRSLRTEVSKVTYLCIAFYSALWRKEYDYAVLTAEVNAR